MTTTTIDMRPEPFELPFFYTQLDILAKNRLNLWQKEGRTLGDGSIFAWHAYGKLLNTKKGKMEQLTYDIGLSSDITKAMHAAKDFVEYYERRADKHGGLNIGDYQDFDNGSCHEWGNTDYYDGSKFQPRSLEYGIRLCFGDGSVLYFKIQSKQLSELQHS